MSARDPITDRYRVPSGPEPSTGYNDLQLVENTNLIFGDNEALKFGDGPDVVCRWDGSIFEILPVTDETGAFNVGDGTYSFDFKVFSTSTANYMLYDVSEDCLFVVVGARTITGEDHAVDISYVGTIASGEAMVGCNVVVTPAGTAGQWASAFYGKVELTDANNPIPGTGYASGAEFEVTVGSGTTPTDIGILVLNDSISCAHASRSAYIWCREYGSTEPIAFFNLYDSTRDSASDAIILSQCPQTPFDTTIRCLAGTTPIYLYGSTVGPASIADFKWIGSGSTKYLEIDATNDRVNMALMGFRWTNAAFTGKCLDFTVVNLAAGSTNNIFSFGDSTTKEVTITDYWLPFRMNISSIANPSGERLASLMFLRFAVTTADQANLDIQGIGLTTEIAKNVGYVHGFESAMLLTDDLTVSMSLHAAKFGIDRTTGKTITGTTGETLSAVLAQISGNGVNASFGSDGGEQGAVIEAKLLSSSDVTSMIWLNLLNGTTATNAITIGNGASGDVTNLFWFVNANPGNCVTVGAYNDAAQNSDGLIRIVVGSTEYFIPFYGTGKVTGEW